MNTDRWSLRRRLVLSLAGMSLTGYIVLSVVWYLFAHVWQPVTGNAASYACLSLPGIYQCAGVN